MARKPPSSFTNLLLRQSPQILQHPNHQFRNIGNNGKREEFLKHDRSQHLSDVVKQICGTIRSKPRWETTLISDFPGVNFSDSSILDQVLRHQNNAFLSIRLLYWLTSTFGYSSAESCSLIFDALVKDKAAKAAKCFLSFTEFVPEPACLESYIRCLCESRMIEDALQVFDEMKNIGACPSLETWNSILLGTIEAGRTDIVWKLYNEMMESGVVVDVDTVDHLIQAFCMDKNVSKGYELLQQILDDGYVPHKIAFDKLIFGFIDDQKYDIVSALLHTMIVKGVEPDLYTYQQIIHGLFMGRMPHEAFRIFNDLKHRGYAPDKIMYTTMIHGLCKVKWLGEARKLWFEMIHKGIKPNHYTYTTLIYGYFRIGNIRGALNLYKEMCDRGYMKSIVTYNTLIHGLCFNGSTMKAFRLFEQMKQKGVVGDMVTYSCLIQGLVKERKLAKILKILDELVEQGLPPLYGGFKEKHIKKGMYLLGYMVKNKLMSKRETLECLIHLVNRRYKLDDVLIVLAYSFKKGCTPKTKGSLIS